MGSALVGRPSALRHSSAAHGRPAHRRLDGRARRQARAGRRGAPAHAGADQCRRAPRCHHGQDRGTRGAGFGDHPRLGPAAVGAPPRAHHPRLRRRPRQPGAARGTRGRGRTAARTGPATATRCRASDRCTGRRQGHRHLRAVLRQPGTGKTLAAHVDRRHARHGPATRSTSPASSTSTSARPRRTSSGSSPGPSRSTRCCSSTRPTRCSASGRTIKDAQDRYANQEIAYLLQRMEQLRRHHGAGDQPARQPRPGVRPPAALHGPLPRPRRADPAPAVGAPPAKLPRIDPADPIDVDAAGRSGRARRRRHPQHRAVAAFRGRRGAPPVGMRHVDGAVRREHTKLGRRAPIGLLGQSRGKIPR